METFKSHVWCFTGSDVSSPSGGTAAIETERTWKKMEGEYKSENKGRKVEMSRERMSGGIGENRVAEKRRYELGSVGVYSVFEEKRRNG